MVALETVAPDTPDTVKEIPASVAEGYTISVLVEVYVFLLLHLPLNYHHLQLLN